MGLKRLKIEPVFKPMNDATLCLEENFTSQHVISVYGNLKLTPVHASVIFAEFAELSESSTSFRKRTQMACLCGINVS